MVNYNMEAVAKVIQEKGVKSPMKPRDIKRVTREVYRDEGLIPAARFYRAAMFQRGNDPGLKASLDTIRDKWGPAEGTKKMASYRIRRCDGNRDAWMIVALRPDGTEIDSNGGWTTSYSVDTLLKNSRHLTPKPGDRVELIP